MKKYLALFAASVFIISLAGCSNAEVNTADRGGSSVGASAGGSSGGASSVGASVEGTSSTADLSGASAGISSEGGTDVTAAPTEGADTSVSATAGTHAADSAASVAPTDPGDTGKELSSSSSEYKPTDIGGLGSGAADDMLVITDGIEAEGAVADFEYSGFADFAAAADDSDVGIIECPVDPEIEYIQPGAGLLTGGEWRDNDHWADWKALYSSHSDWADYKAEWRVNYDSRIAVTVTSGGAPVEGAKVTCDGATSAVTDNRGKAYLFYKDINGATADITVTYGGESKSVGGVTGDGSVSVELDTAASKPEKLDFMIMCDTTGSMSDELCYLQAELMDIVKSIQQANSNTDIRMSVNFYRDEGDEYVVREYPFTADVDSAVRAISEQYATGGGDTPEAVHTALDSALNNHDWDEDAVKIMFLVLDAPPHSSDVQIVDSVRGYIEQAAEMGVRIIPIASSGVDKTTEYLLRTMSFVTGGTYTFLTDDSGIGGGHIEPTVGAYNVEKLNEMMIRIVNGYLE